MVKQGALLTCSGCGATSFIEKPSAAKLLKLAKEGCHITAYSEEQSESWVKVITSFDLCPKCEKVYSAMLSKFYEECGKTEESEENA